MKHWEEFITSLFGKQRVIVGITLEVDRLIYTRGNMKGKNFKKLCSLRRRDCKQSSLLLALLSGLPLIALAKVVDVITTAATASEEKYFLIILFTTTLQYKGNYHLMRRKTSR